jgi:flagellar M-ring protein FliF
MLLAEKGLPESGNTGYELFNQVGSFGLTSFMQEVTRTRALEGELARTIQTMDGIKAARVHIVIPDRSSFRSDQQPASASVVIRTSNPEDTSDASAIRHLVAAAVPGLKVDNVTILNTEGAILASGGDDNDSATTGKMEMLTKDVNHDIEEKIRRTLVPYLGLENFQVSVASILNTDQVVTSETVFDPATRVERSVRVVKENAVAQNSSDHPPTSVAQNIPEQGSPAGAGKSSNEQNDRKEELTNYEISSKKTDTEHKGFTVQKLSIAVLVNKTRLTAAAGTGAEAVSPDQQLMEIEQLVTSAAGVSKDRGDQLKVTSVSFVDSAASLAPVAGPGIVELLVRQAGTVINAAAILILAVLLIWFGLRPAVKAILAQPRESEPALQPAMIGGGGTPLIEGGRPAGAASAHADINLIEDLTNKMNRSPQKRLEQIVEFDEAQAVAILRQWLHQDEKA